MSHFQIEFLNHILIECNYLIKESEQNNLEQLIADERLTRAVCRSLEIIGEASNKIHPDIKSKFKIIPWRELSDLRNKIIHHYFGIDYDIIWNTIITDIPELKENVEQIISSENK